MQYHAIIDSPFGALRIVGSDRAITAIGFVAADCATSATDPAACTTSLAMAIRQLDEYFSGRRQRFELPLAADGTAFQQRVWQALEEIPFGRTCSYGQLAERIGSPGSARAVGAANRSNPIAIVVPCHRVIGGSGALTGYAGGLARKRALLLHEGAAFALHEHGLAARA